MLLPFSEAHQAVGNRVFPDRQMRAAAPPGFGVGVAARGLLDPGEELLRQGVRGGLHGGVITPARGSFQTGAGRSTVLISTFDCSV